MVSRVWSAMPLKQSLQISPSSTENATKFSAKPNNANPKKLQLVQVRAVAKTSTTKVEDWEALDSDVDYLTRSARLVQWYPGHIAKAEKALKEQLKLMDVVIEVRDARIPLATAHPEIDDWMGEHKQKILVLNREDMVSAADRAAWGEYFAKQGVSVLYTNGQRGSGTMKLARMAKSAATGLFGVFLSVATKFANVCAHERTFVLAAIGPCIFSSAESLFLSAEILLLALWRVLYRVLLVSVGA